MTSEAKNLSDIDRPQPDDALVRLWSDTSAARCEVPISAVVTAAVIGKLCWFWQFGLSAESEWGRLATETTGTLGRPALEAFHTLALSRSSSRRFYLVSHKLTV